ncbi:hypothetical protein KIH31_03150 [Paenarthrobacter sp. DKR-5]|uniref:hypothetical protein n=1 Tax=Paenarthrobacter sp. DKR-5 TaxID=2835535 RepID=UPI001BDC5353|nr:hypothetical protein [Paenarthrobacter sp. DKR-5]MBT1001590.1 hypothetical protein [Paenarthrobacter sp. DKR-5]
MRGYPRALPDEMSLGLPAPAAVEVEERPQLTFQQDAYAHCGVPMKPKDATVSSIYAPMSTDPDDEPTIQVYMDSVLLRCDCGFQLVVPLADLAPGAGSE